MCMSANVINVEWCRLCLSPSRFDVRLSHLDLEDVEHWARMIVEKLRFDPRQRNRRRMRWDHGWKETRTDARQCCATCCSVSACEWPQTRPDLQCLVSKPQGEKCRSPVQMCSDFSLPTGAEISVSPSWMSEYPERHVGRRSKSHCAVRYSSRDCAG